ncbi:MAG: thioredoxin family protein [Bacteroidota bacterium]
MKLILPIALIFSLAYLPSNDGGKVSTIELYARNQKKPLETLLKETVSAGKVPIMYFTATWCRPCRAFSKSLKDAQVQEAFAEAVIIKIDVDMDEGEQTMKYGVLSIPTFIKTNEKGEVVARITSSQWKADTPENIAPVMSAFVRSDKFHK